MNLKLIVVILLLAFLVLAFSNQLFPDGFGAFVEQVANKISALF
jgi:hypothetical protein